MTDRWLSVRVHPGTNRDAVLGALFAAGAQAVEEAGEELLTQLPDMGQSEALARAMTTASADARVEIADTSPVNWADRWKHAIRAHDLGAITISPPWLAAGMDPARTVIIEPEMAFGTGEHATTRGVVRLLSSVVRKGDRVADLGAGSAVLAIAAAKLGAASVAAIELDPDAIANAEENVVRNGVADRVVVIEGDAHVLLPLVAPVRLITANIISSVLIGLLPAMRDALTRDGAGEAILSGILEGEREEMTGALSSHGWVVRAEDLEAGWWSCVIAGA